MQRSQTLELPGWQERFFFSLHPQIIHYSAVVPPSHDPAPTLTMPSLLITVFVIQLLIHVVNTVGASTINDLVTLPPFPMAPEVRHEESRIPLTEHK